MPKQERLPTNARKPGILALLGNPTPMRDLLTQLRQLGMQVDVASGLAEARTAFFGSGGHDCLVIGPDVRPGIAARVAASLRAVDPDLPLACFQAQPARTERRAGDAVLAFHPSSRAGTGALLRFLQALRLR